VIFLAFIARIVGPLLALICGCAWAQIAISLPTWQHMLTHNHVHALWFYDPPIMFVAGGCLLGVAITVLGMMSKAEWQSTKESTSHGSARFATTKELRRKNYKDKGIPLCMEDTASYLSVELPDGRLGWQLERESKAIATADYHVFVEGPAGAGKDQCIVYPTLLQDIERSYVINDPKGKAYEMTAGYRSAYSVVFRFAPSEPTSARYNPLLEIPVGTYREVPEATRIASALVQSAAAEEMSSRIYLKLCELLMTAAILHAVNLPKRSDRTLPNVLRILTSCQGRDGKQELVHNLCKNLPKSADLVASNLHELAEDQRMLQSAFTTTLDVLGFCTNPMVANAISDSDFVASDLTQRKQLMSLYLVFPFRDKNILRPLVRLVMDTLLAHHRDERKHDTVYLLNELDSLGKITAIPEGITEQREQGVRFILCAQSSSQIYATYGKDAAITILNNCRVRVTLGISGQDAAEDASKRMGKATLVRPRQTQAVSRKGLLESTVTNTKGEGEQAREFMTPDEVKIISDDKVLVELPGVRPYLGVRFFQYAMPELLRRSKIPAPPPRIRRSAA
jgi:type IV secretion system protein VirD4